MATASSLVKRVLRKLGNTTPSAEQEIEGLEALNGFLGYCAAERLIVPVITSESFPLVAGTNTYTIGTSGNFNTTRPIKIVDAFIRDSSNNDYPLEIISKSEYNDTELKTTRSRPDALEYSPEYPLGKIRLYLTPSTADTLFIDSWKPLGVIALLTDTVNLPPMYDDFIVFNLTVNMASDYGVKLTPEIVGRAEQTKKNIKSANIPTTPVARFDSALSGGQSVNIITG